jgi:phosphoglycolate phosphatase-like HAD superfamily hydrolase
MHCELILNKYDTFIFDNDGVIIDSNNAKTEAFIKALDGERTDLIDKFVKYHHNHGGVSRYEKIKHFFLNIKQDKDCNSAIEKALEKYSFFAKKALLNSRLIPGVEDFLGLLKENNRAIHVVSGSDQNELIDVYQARGLDKYFNSVFGSPRKKSDIVQKIVNDGINLPAVYFGDAFLDYSVALEHNLDFIFISHGSEWLDGEQFCRNSSCTVEKDFL